ncbi:hypothetical protein LXL04_016383 [Taraxacum kok-saghyz]
MGFDVNYDNSKPMYNLFMEYASDGTISDAINKHGESLDEFYWVWIIFAATPCVFFKKLGCLGCDFVGCNLVSLVRRLQPLLPGSSTYDNPLHTHSYHLGFAHHLLDKMLKINIRKFTTSSDPSSSSFSGFDIPGIPDLTKGDTLKSLKLKLLRVEVETRLSRQVEEAEAHQDRLCTQLSVMFSNGRAGLLDAVDCSIGKFRMPMTPLIAQSEVAAVRGLAFGTNG